MADRYEGRGRASDFTRPEQYLTAMKKVADEPTKLHPKPVWYHVPDYSKPKLPNPEHAKWTAPRVVKYGFTLVVRGNALA